MEKRKERENTQKLMFIEELIRSKFSYHKAPSNQFNILRGLMTNQKGEIRETLCN